jgi:biopolymer transport protein ExbD
MKLTRRKIKRGRIEIVPMIDTILILLIFYMSFSTLTQREKHIDAKLPPTEGIEGGALVPPTQEMLDLSLHVHDRSHIIVNGNDQNPYNITQLGTFLDQYSAVGQEMTVVIRGNPDTLYQDIIATLDVCALAKLTRVGIHPLGPQANPESSSP